MAISYAAALKILENTAQEVSTNFEVDPDVVSLEDAVGRVSKNAIFSPVSTPAADTSAMDGYAVDSSCTHDACDANPVSLRVVGFLTAGDRTARLPLSTCKACSVATTAFSSCIEIATGAQFPAAPYDACIRVEDTSPTDPCLRPSHNCPYQYITIVRPVKHNQHRRPAGEDFTKHHVVLHAGETVQPQHVMGLAAVGIGQIKVTPRLRIGIVSTGSELVPVNNQTNDIEDFQLRNSNGPYLCAAAKHIGAEVDFLGLVEDHVQDLRARLEDALSKQRTHLIVSTGAVSVGKFDFVRQGIEGLGASVKFHKVSVRPGHPVLFATLPRGSNGASPAPQRADAVGHGLNEAEQHKSSAVSFFGLPGNPLASAACFRFFVIPYLRYLQGQPLENPKPVKIKESSSPGGSQMATHPLPRLDQFRLGKRRQDLEAPEVELIAKQGSSLISPFLEADCWVIIPSWSGHSTEEPFVKCLPLHPPSLGISRRDIIEVAS